MSKSADLDAHIEDQRNIDLTHSEKADLELSPILDKYGFPLVPQPTSHKDDPLVSRAEQPVLQFLRAD